MLALLPLPVLFSSTRNVLHIRAYTGTLPWDAHHKKGCKKPRWWQGQGESVFLWNEADSSIAMSPVISSTPSHLGVLIGSAVGGKARVRKERASRVLLRPHCDPAPISSTCMRWPHPTGCKMGGTQFRELWSWENPALFQCLSPDQAGTAVVSCVCCGKFSELDVSVGSCVCCGKLEARREPAPAQALSEIAPGSRGFAFSRAKRTVCRLTYN